MSPFKAPKARKPRRKPMGGPRTYGRLQKAIDEVVDREIRAALNETQGNVSEAARILGISRPSLWARMRALGITAPR